MRMSRIKIKYYICFYLNLTFACFFTAGLAVKKQTKKCINSKNSIHSLIELF